MAVIPSTSKLAGLRTRLNKNSGIVGRSVKITNPKASPRGRNSNTQSIGMGRAGSQGTY